VIIGSTPLLELDGVLAKAEFLNPTGSIKDRLVGFLLSYALADGKLKQGMTIVEATSGNTGISLAFLAKRMGFNAVVFMPETASLERGKMISLLGARLELTKTRDEATEKAMELGAEENHFYLNQFESDANPLAHYHGTGREILEQFSDRIDSVVIAVGTGGTLYGTGKRIRERWPEVEIVGVLPAEKENLIEGLRHEYSARVVPEGFIDRIVRVKNEDALQTTKELIREKGVLAGISAGANFFAAKRFGVGRTVTVLPDSWDRYFSTRLFESN